MIDDVIDFEGNSLGSKNSSLSTDVTSSCLSESEHHFISDTFERIIDQERSEWVNRFERPFDKYLINISLRNATMIKLPAK